MPVYLKNYTYPFRLLRQLFLIAGSLLGISSTSLAQKYTFTHYNIEDGLVQSQVNKFSQDRSHCLWMGTLGGACKFNGRDFTSYSKENGLVNNFIYSVYCDKKNRVWLGSHMGVSCLTGDKLTNYPLPPNIKRTWVTHIAEDRQGTIWLTMDAKLFKVTGNKLAYVPITDVAEYSISNITVNNAGRLFVTVAQNGIYTLQGNKWINSIPFPESCKKLEVTKVIFDRFDDHKAYLLYYNQLLVAKDGVLSPYPLDLGTASVALISIAQDARGDLWLGSSSGAYYIKNNKMIHLDAQNGASDASIADIYCDNDNNIWLATWGDGIYKYEGDSYVLFDQLRGFGNLKSIMGIAKDKQHNILLASDGAGIIQYNGKAFKSIDLPGTNPNSKRIQCIYNDRDSNVWVGTSLGGLWKYDGKKYQLIPNTDGKVANSISQDGSGTIWVAAPLGCFYYSNDTLRHLDNVNGFIASLLPIGRDSMLIGTQYGVKLVINKKLVPTFNISDIASANILCMIRFHDLVLFGTGDQGIFIWNKNTGVIKKYNVKNGLNSNAIYNLIALENNVVWAGTGRGLNRFKIDPATLGLKVIGGGSKDLIAEANQNSVLYTDGKIWMGTTKGLIVYDPKTDDALASKPYVVIRSVKLFNQQNSKDQPTDLISTLKNGSTILYSQNHIAISFLGIYLKDPKGVSYQYKLTGLDGSDDKFCTPVKNGMVDYPSLPAGKYTFQVKAITDDGIPSDNVATFSFEITPPFYQTWPFRILLLLSFVLIGISLQTYMHKRKLRAVKMIERMKREEKQKIRKQTAEDFHDDLGNKLTRITILSDILSSKIADEKGDQQKLIGQIKQNAEALYVGTKDILWALDPKSDNLYEILTHIKHFGIELFHDTDIEFGFDHIDKVLSNIKLPMEYSRNMTMIYKELLNNILKHAAATRVDITLSNHNNNAVVIILTDNGKGFDPQTTVMGHGINNIKNRAARLDCTIDTSSVIGKGTKTVFTLKLKT